MKVYMEIEVEAASEKEAVKAVNWVLSGLNVDILSYSETEEDEPEVIEDEDEDEDEEEKET